MKKYTPPPKEQNATTMKLYKENVKREKRMTIGLKSSLNIANYRKRNCLSLLNRTSLK